jgi:hypothetical protein
MTRLSNTLSGKNLPLAEMNVGMFISIVSFGLVGFYCVSRLGFETSYSDIRNLIGVNFFVILFPFIFQLFTTTPKTDERSSLVPVGFSGVLSLASFVFLILLSFAIPHTGYWVLTMVVAAGYLFSIITLLLFLKVQRWYVSLAMLVLPSLFVVWLFGRVYSSYLSPLAFENLVLGISILDTFYHSSIMKMIQTYGVPSTGLDGTP